MVYLLFFTVLAMGIFAFSIFNRDVLSPSFWTCIMFAISIFVNILNADRWGTSYSMKAYFIIVLGLFSIALGEITADLVHHSTTHSDNGFTRESSIASSYDISGVTILIFTFISLICLWVDIRIMKHIAGTSNITDIVMSLKAVRGSLSSGEASKGVAGRIAFAVNKGISYTFIIIIMHNKILCRTKAHISMVIPIIAFCIELLLSTGRVGFIRIITYTFFLFILFYIRVNGTRLKQLLRIFGIGLLALVLFYSIFTIVGRTMGKGIYNTATDVIQYYTGSSIYLFNQYIEAGAQPTSKFLGEHTLYGIYNMLCYIIPSIQHVSDPSLEMSYIPNWYSNLYTAFRRYYQDFGYTGMFFVPYIIGIVYGWLKNKAELSQYSEWKCVLYAYAIYPIIEIAIEERFLCNILSFSTFFELVVIYIVFFIATRFEFVFGTRSYTRLSDLSEK